MTVGLGWECVAEEQLGSTLPCRLFPARDPQAPAARLPGGHPRPPVCRGRSLTAANLRAPTSREVSEPPSTPRRPLLALVRAAPAMAALRRLLWPPPRLPPPPSAHQPFPGPWGRPAGIAPGPPGRPFSRREEEEGAVAEAAWRRRRRWGELSIAAAAGGGLVGLVCYQLYGDPKVDSTRAPAPGRPFESAAPEPEDPPRGRGLLPIPVTAAKETVAIGRTDIEDLDLYATSRERRFRLFASIECEGQLFMTPYDFILAVTTDEPKFAKTWKSLSKQELNQMLSGTPPVWKGSSKLFRNLKERGVISYTEYLFLLCILTKPHAGFRIAFNMFDTDGNEMVDKKEFLVLQEIFRKKNEKRETKGDEEKRAMLVLKTDAEEHVSRSYWDTLRRNTSQALFSDLAERADDITSLVTDTTLLVHFFGKKGKAELNFEDFYRFMDNLQTEVLEIEFLSYSNGMNTISEEDFAHILLRYTNVENTSVFLENVRYSIPEEKGITFDEFRSFFQFLNNLEDFAIALNMYNFASRSIGQDEFKRAVYVATGLKFSPHLVNTVFKIFDVDKDDQLSYKEFIGIMKDRLHRGFRGYKTVQKYPTFKSCLKKELHSR
ncbi:calcium uptake protein 3, mitochondrial isoform X2 [Manis pentadactyla]|uniref:calcium uptake protein 3, mitochondrial isoform X2 n=1 Tax=Manis pentadactyla TaxID=143292 RepID=UPI00255D15EC|nr:calcium uptake protein 3, mitochondrial isoform X2 [Manis pentadactyla]